MNPDASDLSQSSRPRLLWWHWLLWLVWLLLALLTAASACLYSIISQPQATSLRLEPGQIVNTGMWNLWLQAPRMGLVFQRQAGQQRPELGGWQTPTASADMPAAPSLATGSPGVPLKLEIAINGEQAFYGAQPATEAGDTALERRQAPCVGDAPPGQPVWPSAGQGQLLLPVGHPAVQVSVREVDPALLGEQVQLVLHAPLENNGLPTPYRWMRWLQFWPSSAQVLALAGLLLAWVCWRRRQRNADRMPWEV